MKNKVFLLNLALAAILFAFTNCGGKCTWEEDPVCFCEKNPTNELCVDPKADRIEVDRTSVTVVVGSTVKVNAVLKDKNGNVVGGTITWKSEATGTALVSADGTITGMSVGKTNVVASCGSLPPAFVEVNVTGVIEGGYSNAPSLQGFDYFVIYLPQGAMDYLNIRNQLFAYLGPDDMERFLWIWPGDPGTLAGEETSGKNSFGVADGWMSFTVNSGWTWSGAGYFSRDFAINDKMAKISQEADKYYLHIAYKTMQADRSSMFIFNAKNPGIGATKANLVLGKVPFTDAGTTYQPYDANFHADGEWNVYDIPFSYLANQGLIYRTGNTEGENLMSFLCGAIAGTTCEYDAVFFYKKMQ